MKREKLRFTKMHGQGNDFIVLDGVRRPLSITPERARVEDSGQVTVDMGPPRFEPREVPFLADAPRLTYELRVAGMPVEVSVLSMGNPHAVQIVPVVKRAPVQTQGPLLERHPSFPQRVNAGYMQVLDRGHVRLRVWERGAGETLACGTGACAAVVSGIRLGLLDAQVRVATRGGNLTIGWPGPGSNVMMTGDAMRVFDGEIDL